MVKDIKVINAKRDDIEVFNSKCKLSNGRLNILVHPFFSENTTPTLNKRYVTKKYLKKRDEYIREALDSNTPLIFFQQSFDYKNLPSRISQIGDYTIYTVKTKNGEETPKGGRKEWNMLADILSKGEIKIVTVSGLYLVYEPINKAIEEFDIKYDKEKIQLEFINMIPKYIDKYPIARKWLKKNFVPTGCVGYTIMNLLKYGFDVSIGELTAPD